MKKTKINMATGGYRSMLEYECNIFDELRNDDGLLVLARGLGLETIMMNFLQLYCTSEHLVIVLNTHQFEEEFIISELGLKSVKKIPQVITNEINASERSALYLEGGVLFVTARILVVDLLTKRIPIHLISGMVVGHAHKIGESGQEAFILRLFRQDNKVGFIKGLSDSPTMFLSGFCHIERIMKSLFVRKLFIWPRFHANVSSVLERHKPDVVELHLKLTPLMNTIQLAVLDLMSACMKDLKQSNPTLDQDELTVENCITKSFDKSMRFVMDPHWHQISQRTKQLLSDIKVLRTLLLYLTQYDCVTFFDFLEILRGNEHSSNPTSLWMYMDAGNALFESAKYRVSGCTSDGDKKKKKKDKVSTDIEGLSEENPKWRALLSVLDEIKEMNPNSDSNSVLVAMADQRTCSQLRQLICDGPESLMKSLIDKSPTLVHEKFMKSSPFNIHDIHDQGQTKGPAFWNPRGNSGNTSAKKPNNCNLEADINIPTKEDVGVSLDNHDNDLIVLSDDSVVLHPLHGNSDPYSLLRTLYDFEPRFVILYDAEVEFVRQIEVYKASRPGIPLRVYFLIYSGSVEEQRYLTNLRREKEAFESIIRSKATMVVPEERDGKSENAMEQLRDISKPYQTNTIITNQKSRKAGGRNDDKAKNEQAKVIVDMREFRSDLPSLLHRRGIDIEPVTLQVGDYVLTPDICVERKSVSDLIGSLNSGRLYTQVVSMTRHYKRSILLIEFDQSKSFGLQLGIIWTQSPHATAEIFQDLKMGKDEPDRNIAMAIGVDPNSVASTVRYNIGPQDFLMKLPGVNSKNCRFILKKVHNLKELFNLSKDELSEILSNSKVAHLIWTFLHRKQSILDVDKHHSKKRLKNYPNHKRN